MKISARNVFEGEVTAVKEGPIHAEVELRLPTGETIVAAVTEGSVQTLGVKVGSKALAIVKAPLVALVTEATGWRFTARNQLAGTVDSVQKGSVNASVSLRLPGGAAVSSVITNQAVDDLGLAPGVKATALFKAATVVLALPA